MEHVNQPSLFLFFMCMMITISYAADFLQNPDFEIPPSNTTTNSSTSEFLLLTKANTLPGWSINGTVSYVTSGRNLSFPDNGGHALQLGENGTIKQTLRANKEVLDYVLTFNLIPQSEDCANDRTAVNVSVNGSYRERSVIFSLERNLTRNLWQSHAFFLGRLGDESLDIRITSVKTNYSQDDNNNNVTCWPLVDAFTVKSNWLTRWYDGNAIGNEGFEIGPAFLKNSSDGIILDQEQDRFNSPLQEWSILGKIKYIDSKHYKVPRGKAAIELVSGDPSGVRMDLFLQPKLTYTLNFTMGDANNSCAGDFIVYVQVGDNVHNFTMRSNGTGSAFKRSITFKAELPSTMETSIVFYSFNETRTSYGVLCGPILDTIILKVSGGGRVGTSYGERMKLYDGVSIFSLFTALVVLML